MKKALLTVIVRSSAPLEFTENPALADTGDMRCRFELVIPETDDVIVDLGEVECSLREE